MFLCSGGDFGRTVYKINFYPKFSKEEMIGGHGCGILVVPKCSTFTQKIKGVGPKLWIFQNSPYNNLKCIKRAQKETLFDLTRKIDV